MKHIRFSDMTLKTKANMTFKEKLETAKLLDRLLCDVIEMNGIIKGRADVLFIKSVAQAVKHSCIAIPVSADVDDTAVIWDALKEAGSKRLQVVMPASIVQMEYISHKKPDVMLDEAIGRLEACLKLTGDVEFIAADATRADPDFLVKALTEAVRAGASTVTVCDTAGSMLPDEFGAFTAFLYERVPGLDSVTLGVSCANSISMAVANAVEGIMRGAGEVKVSAVEKDAVLLSELARLLSVKGGELDASCAIRATELNRTIERIERITSLGRSSNSPFEDGVREDGGETVFTLNDSEAAVDKAVKSLGYDLSDEDSMKVYRAFVRIAERKESVSQRELEVIIASEAMQVPESYTLSSYMVTSSNQIDAMAHLKLVRDGSVLTGISPGDGPIDAAFLAIEKIIGCHYELDDFQIQAITEGREAMGQTIVKLRAGGRLYSGRGISTDIIGSGIKAYINALNKIVFEEEQE